MFIPVMDVAYGVNFFGNARKIFKMNLFLIGGQANEYYFFKK